MHEISDRLRRTCLLYQSNRLSMGRRSNPRVQALKCRYEWYRRWCCPCSQLGQSLATTGCDYLRSIRSNVCWWSRRSTLHHRFAIQQRQPRFLSHRWQHLEYQWCWSRLWIAMCSHSRRKHCSSLDQFGQFRWRWFLNCWVQNHRRPLLDCYISWTIHV